MYVYISQHPGMCAASEFPMFEEEKGGFVQFLISPCFKKKETDLCSFLFPHALRKRLVCVVYHAFQNTFGQHRGSPDTPEHDAPDATKLAAY